MASKESIVQAPPSPPPAEIQKSLLLESTTLTPPTSTMTAHSTYPSTTEAPTTPA